MEKQSGKTSVSQNNFMEVYVYEILVKVGDNTNPDPNKDKSCYKDGDIIFVARPSESKRVWEEMLRNGRCTQIDFNNAQIQSGEFKWPWGKEEKRIHQVFILNDELTDGEARGLVEEKTSIIPRNEDSTGKAGQAKILLPPQIEILRRRNYKINIDELSYVCNGLKVRFPKNIIDEIRNKSIVVEPMYDKPIPKSEIVQK